MQRPMHPRSPRKVVVKAAIVCTALLASFYLATFAQSMLLHFPPVID